MKTIGIVSEYNPFHNGHRYLAETAKKELDADAVISVMSGNFTQRGEIASFDMYSRAAIACQNGIDLVLEIPPQFVLQSAEFYAMNGVSMLHRLGIVDYLAFGSESGNLFELQQAQKPDADFVKEQMKRGIPYAKAVGACDLLQSANNILGVEYLNALKKCHSDIIPYTVKRKSVSHNSTVPSGEFASASYIRNAIRNKERVSEYVPSLPDSQFVWEDAILPMLHYRLAHCSSQELSDIQNISEGLQNRILSTRGKDSFRDLIDAVKCKRYPETRIRRALYCILLDIKKSEELPCYTRVLAFSETGQKLLKHIKKSSELTVYSRITKADIYNNPQLQKEIFCNEIYSYAQQICKKGSV